MKDSGLLIYDANHDSNSTAPCDDFKVFAMGTFYEHRVPNERYSYSGFLSDVDLQYKEKQKRMLKQAFNESDSKIFKIMKSFFQQCINSSNEFAHLHIFFLI